MASIDVIPWFRAALVESLGLNIELIEMVASVASPELREGAAFQIVIHRVEQLKEMRGFLLGGESEDEAPA